MADESVIKAVGWQAELGERIRSRREELGLTLTRLAELAACSKGYLSEIETGRRASPPREAVLRELEGVLLMSPGALVSISTRAKTPEPVRMELEALRARVARMERSPRNVVPASLEQQVPVINRVRAGLPTEYTDLGLPVGVADEYVVCPGLSDPDAFAARVVGDSMAPRYLEGDVVVFSPLKDVKDGSDCFVRLEPDHESTFKRVFFEAGDTAESVGGNVGGRIRLVALNERYGSRVVDRERVAGLFAAAQVIRPV